MEIYLDHPKNGAAVACDTAELEKRKAEGYVVRDPQPGLKPSANPLADINRVVAPPRRKKGGA